MHWLLIVLAHFLPITELEKEKGEGIREYRGFLTEDGSGNIYLTDVPNLKSCCVGKGKGIELLLVDFKANPISKHLTAVRGYLKLRDGKYVLEQLEYLPDDRDFSWIWVVAGLACFGGCIFFIPSSLKSFLKKHEKS